ncbi:unnamed protein product, partial [Polarella glacialis]
CNSLGQDLNRCWERPPAGSEVGCAKKLLQELCLAPGGVLAYLDMHAHSRRHGAFTLSNPGSQALIGPAAASEARVPNGAPHAVWSGASWA